MKIAHGTLVMAIDGGKMLLFRNEGDEKFIVLDTLSHDRIDHPSSREIGSDAPGRTFSSSDVRRSAYAETDWHAQAEEQFAIRAAEGLERVALNDKAGIVVIAPPHMLGQLRRHWGRKTRDRLMAEIAKDVVRREWDDIACTIADYDAPPPG
jgi:protein required for attachment to host cells